MLTRSMITRENEESITMKQSIMRTAAAMNNPVKFNAPVGTTLHLDVLQ